MNDRPPSSIIATVTQDSSGLLTIVVPVRDEKLSVGALCAEVAEALDGRDYELLFVDDGSTDGTYDAIRQERERDPRVRGLRFRANAGKSAAYAAGFRAARGEIVATMDGDLQDNPKDLLKLLEPVEAGSVDLAVGWKIGGKSSSPKFVLSRIANLALRLVTRLSLHDMNCPLRVMRRDVAKSLDLRADLHRYIPLMAAARGFTVTEISVENRPRQHGESKYGSSKYVRSATALLGVGLYVRFGERPMALFGGAGILAFVAGFAVCATVAIRFLAFGADIDDDIPTLILGALLLLIGMQAIGLGLMGEIIVRRISVSEDQGPSEVVEEL